MDILNLVYTSENLKTTEIPELLARVVLHTAKKTADAATNRKDRITSVSGLVQESAKLLESTDAVPIAQSELYAKVLNKLQELAPEYLRS